MKLKRNGEQIGRNKG